MTTLYYITIRACQRCAHEYSPEPDTIATSIILHSDHWDRTSGENSGSGSDTGLPRSVRRARCYAASSLRHVGQSNLTALT